VLRSLGISCLNHSDVGFFDIEDGLELKIEAPFDGMVLVDHEIGLRVVLPNLTLSNDLFIYVINSTDLIFFRTRLFPCLR